MEITYSLQQEKEIAKYCSVWHVHGPGITSASAKVFIDTLKSKLPNVKLPVTIGSTGYTTIACSTDKFPVEGWCLDIADRFTATMKGYLIFQRYTHGGPVMYGKLNESATNIMDLDAFQKLIY